MLLPFTLLIILLLVFRKPIGYLLDIIAEARGWNQQEDYYEPTRGLASFDHQIGPPKRKGFSLWFAFWMIIYAIASYSMALNYPAFFFVCPSIGAILLVIAIVGGGRILGLLGGRVD